VKYLPCKNIKKILNHVWWCTPVIPAFGRLRQEDHEFKASLGHIARLCLKKKDKKKSQFMVLPYEVRVCELASFLLPLSLPPSLSLCRSG
jgi:hypothetical protein